MKGNTLILSIVMLIGVTVVIACAFWVLWDNYELLEWQERWECQQYKATFCDDCPILEARGLNITCLEGECSYWHICYEPGTNDGSACVTPVYCVKEIRVRVRI